MPVALLAVPGTLLLLVVVLFAGAWAEARLLPEDSPPSREPRLAAALVPAAERPR